MKGRWLTNGNDATPEVGFNEAGTASISLGEGRLCLMCGQWVVIGFGHTCFWNAEPIRWVLAETVQPKALTWHPDTHTWTPYEPT